MEGITEANTRNNTNNLEIVVEQNPSQEAEPRRSVNGRHDHIEDQRSEVSSIDPVTGADPERKVTLLALHLAFLEKAATLLSTICFVWATVVLLGGFAITLEVRDFWFVTAIILVEATRVFGRSHELELQETPVWIPIESVTTRQEAPATSTTAERSVSMHHSDVPPVSFCGILSKFITKRQEVHETCTTAETSTSSHHPKAHATGTTTETSTSMHHKDVPLNSSGGIPIEPAMTPLEAQATDAVTERSASMHHSDVLQVPSGGIPNQSITTPQEAPATDTTVKRSASMEMHPSDVPLVPFGGRIFVPGNIRILLYWIQVMSATACVVLSVIRLAEHSFGATHDKEQHSNEQSNRNSALFIFYSLALAEALTFLIERAYREWKFNYKKLIQTVSEELTLGTYGEESIRRFFYRAYSKSISGSILDSIKMDMVSFAQELLISNSHEEQLIGVHVLKCFVTDNEWSSTTLKRIATSTNVVERLIDMLNWKSLTKTQIRYMAAEIVLNLTGKMQNVLRIGKVPGAVESIRALLDSSHPNNDSSGNNYQENISFKFNKIGLQIIQKLARDHGNAGVICNARGLLSRIIYFTKTKSAFLQNAQEDDIGIIIVQESLNVIRDLVGTVGHTGKKLRSQISDNIFLLANLRKLLIHRMNHANLQIVAIEILMDLAKDETAAEKIGSTGGIISQLLAMFTDSSFSESVRSKAGDGLASIALGSEENCIRVIREDKIEELKELLRSDSNLQLTSSGVLLSLCTYTTKDEHWSKLRGIISVIPTVIRTIMYKEDKINYNADKHLHEVLIEYKKLLEVSIGLAAQLIKHAEQQEYEDQMNETDFTEDAIASILWLSAVELALLKGRHPLLEDIDISINPSKSFSFVNDKVLRKKSDRRYKEPSTLPLNKTPLNRS
ncbi:ARM repeat superfamily protein [Rhynchospora pubera]|uniref:ARM repeat superfamily protein n=1 Tax=Rhynchospora pubera TaxID=906938 RepID=A0AAV8FLQ1_9POAL|nr:ARM repeat superfamily protein [Rhynchospora pubera]